MGQTVYRVVKNKENPYVVLNKAFLEDDTLSWKAKGLLAYLLSKPDDWRVMEADLIKQSKDGRDAVRTALHELIDARYVIRRQVRDEAGQFGGTTYFVYEQPTDDIDPESPKTEIPSSAPKPEITSSVSPKPENPTSDNHPLLNNHLTKYSRSQNNDPTKRGRNKNVTTSRHQNDYDPRYHTFYQQTDGERYAAYMDANPEYVDAVRKFWPDAV